MSRVFWDTNIFIYLFENYGELSEQAGELRRKMLARGDRLLTSALTLGEILVKPTEQHDVELCRKYEEAILATSLVLPFDSKVARNYALLRCDRPSALQMPCSWLVLRQQAWICSSPTMRGCKTRGWREFSSSCPWTVCRCEASHCGSMLSLPTTLWRRRARPFATAQIRLHRCRLPTSSTSGSRNSTRARCWRRAGGRR